MYLLGIGVTKDYDQALKWLRKAAENNVAKAQSSLGSMYYRGNGVTKSYAKALKWFRRAAERGFADAQYNLAYMYGVGEGVPQSFRWAYIWSTLAAADGNTKATQLRDMVAETLSFSELNEAQEKASEIFSRISSSQ